MSNDKKIKQEHAYACKSLQVLAPSGASVLFMRESKGYGQKDSSRHLPPLRFSDKIFFDLKVAVLFLRNITSRIYHKYRMKGDNAYRKVKRKVNKERRRLRLMS